MKSLKCLTILSSCIMLNDQMIAWHMILWFCIQLTWPDILSTWHWYLTPDTWHLTSDIWQLTCYHLILDMLSYGTDTFDMMLWHLTRYYYIRHLYYIAYSWLSLLRGLDMNIIMLPFGTLELLYFWTPVFLNPWNRETPDTMLLLIPIVTPRSRGYGDVTAMYNRNTLTYIC